MRDKFDLKELTNEIPLGEFLKYDEPLLVSRTNAVSGKLLLASEMSRFDRSEEHTSELQSLV